MSKRALKRQLREGAFDAGQFDADDKIRRLPLDTASLVNLARARAVLDALRATRPMAGAPPPAEPAGS